MKLFQFLDWNQFFEDCQKLNFIFFWQFCFLHFSTKLQFYLMSWLCNRACFSFFFENFLVAPMNVICLLWIACMFQIQANVSVLTAERDKLSGMYQEVRINFSFNVSDCVSLSAYVSQSVWLFLFLPNCVSLSVCVFLSISLLCMSDCVSLSVSMV